MVGITLKIRVRFCELIFSLKRHLPAILLKEIVFQCLADLLKQSCVNAISCENVINNIARQFYFLSEVADWYPLSSNFCLNELADVEFVFCHATR